jgi:hypothetical protein
MKGVCPRKHAELVEFVEQSRARSELTQKMVVMVAMITSITTGGSKMKTYWMKSQMTSWRRSIPATDSRFCFLVNSLRGLSLGGLVSSAGPKAAEAARRLSTDVRDDAKKTKGRTQMLTACSYAGRRSTMAG